MTAMFRRSAVIASAALLAACGGGSGTSSQPGRNSNVVTNGTFALSIAGGAGPGVKEAWVRVYKVAFNEDADKPWDPTDSTWVVRTLRAPVAVDLASPLNNFVVGDDPNRDDDNASRITIPAKTYGQVRLFFLEHDASTTDYPLPTVTPYATSTPRVLTYQAEIKYDSGVVVPIEWPNLQSGVKLDRGVVIRSDTLTSLTSKFDVERSLVRFDGDLVTHHAALIRPRTYTYQNAEDVNEIEGGRGAVLTLLVDPDYVCGLGVSTNCVSDMMVSLYAKSGDESRMENWGGGRVLPLIDPRTSDKVAAFVTILSYSPLGGGLYDNPTSYDMVIRGSGMKTMVIRNITLNNTLKTIGCPTVGIAAKIRPILDASPRSVVLRAGAPLDPKSGRVSLGFRIQEGSTVSLPYEVHSVNTDPFTGLFASGLTMSVPGSASSDVLVATDAALETACANLPSGQTVFNLTDEFEPATLADGAGNFVPMSLATFYTDGNIGAASSSTSTLAGNEFDVALPTPVVGLQSQSVNVSVTGLSTVLSGFGGTRKAKLVVSDVGGIVATADLSGCSTNPCTTSVSLPAGSAGNASATGVYEFAIRYWNSSTPTTAQTVAASGGTMRWARASSFLNLRSGTVSPNPTVNIAVP